MTGGEWSFVSNYRSCCELAEAEMLLGFSHNRIFTRQMWVCVFDLIIDWVCPNILCVLYRLWMGRGGTCCFKHLEACCVVCMCLISQLAVEWYRYKFFLCSYFSWVYARVPTLHPAFPNLCQRKHSSFNLKQTNPGSILQVQIWLFLRWQIWQFAKQNEVTSAGSTDQ